MDMADANQKENEIMHGRHWRNCEHEIMKREPRQAQLPNSGGARR